MMSRIFHCFFIYFICSCTLFAQNPIWSEIELEEEINLEYLQTDTIGFVWCLSKDGFYKYDGLQLSKKLEAINSSSQFTTFNTDNAHNFLIGTIDGNLIKYNPYQDKIISQQSLEEDYPITYLDCADSDSSCLTLSYGNGIKWVDNGIDTFLTIDNILISNEVYAAVRYDGKAVLATDQGIQIIEHKDQKISSELLNKNNGLGDVIIPNLIKDKDYYWASNFDSQIYQIDNSSLDITIIDLPVVSKINGIMTIGDSEVCVYTDSGLYTLHQGEWHKNYPIEGSKEVLDITIDEEKNLWVCSANNVLSKANLAFQLLPNPISKVQAILRINNSFWIGNSEGLYIVEGDTQREISSENITCLKRIKDDILVGTFSSGIQILNKKGKVIDKIDGWENNPNQSVLYLYLSDDYLYVSSLTGVMKMKLGKNNGKYTTSEYQSLNNLLGPGYIYQILKNDEDLYFATDRQGIKLIRGDSLLHFTQFEDGNIFRSIYSMTECVAGNIWFSTSTGYIGYVKDSTVVHIESERFLRDPYTSLVSTSDQKIVMVRNSSIDIYDPESNHFIYYEDLVTTSDQNLYLNNFTQDENYIWLSKSNGILEIGNSQSRKLMPEPIIHSIKVNLVDVGERIFFREDHNNFEFKYSTAWLTDPERIAYQYKLEGLDKNWRTTRDKTAIYPMVQPGNYTFRIKASKDGNFINAKEKTYQFTIKKSIYKKKWFLFFVLLLAGGLIIKWRDQRKKIQLQKETQNKKRIEAQLISLQTQLNPHFLFNSFNTLIGLIEEDPERSITFTEKLTDFYRNILELGKNDFIPLKEEINLIRTYIHLLKERFGNQLEIILDLHNEEIYKIPPLTLQLLIENAVKHNIVSSKNPLSIHVKQTDDKVLVSNDVRLKYGQPKGTGIGLENIMKRHTLNNLKPPTIEESEEQFKVTIYLSPIEL